MAEASKGGCVSVAARSSASTRPYASPRGIRSTSSGPSPFSTRASASSTGSRAIGSGRAEGAGAAAGLLDQPNAGEGHGAVDRLAHVVEGEARDGNRGQRLHFHARLAFDFGRGFHAQTDGVALRREVERDLGEGQGMAERDQLG